MEPPDNKLASEIDTRIIQLGSASTTAHDYVGESKNESDEKTVQTDRRAKKRTPIAVQRDDDDDDYR